MNHAILNHTPILLFSPENIAYITALIDAPLQIDDSALLIEPDGSSTLFADARYIERARTALADKTDCILAKDGLLQAVAERLKGRTDDLEIEFESITHGRFNRLRELLPNLQFSDVSQRLLERRAIKTPYEIDCIRKASKIMCEAYEATLPKIKAQICAGALRECEVAALLEYEMRIRGSERPAFDTICISGTKTAMPHGATGENVIGNGFLTMDFGAVYKGYHSDITRTIAIGSVSDEMRKVYDTVLAAQLKALEFIRPGVACAEIDRAARDVIEQSGYAGKFLHGLGHGIGLQIHELPRLSPKAEGTLVAGNAVTVEPGIYLEGKMGVRIEDSVLVTENGMEILTPMSKELIVL